MSSQSRLRVLQWLTVLVPAVCAGLYETVCHSLLAAQLPTGLGTLLAAAVVLAISSVFARVAFGLIRQMEPGYSSVTGSWRPSRGRSSAWR